MPTFIRETGQLETAMSLMHHRFHGTMQAANYVTLAPAVDNGIILAAFKTVVAAYQALRCIITIEENRCYISEKDQVAIEATTLAVATPAELDTLLFEQVSTPIDCTQSLWRLILIDGPGETTTIMQVFHHAIVDVNAYSDITHNFLRAIDRKLANGDSQLEDSQIEDKKVPPPIEHQIQHLTMKVPPGSDLKPTPIRHEKTCAIAHRRLAKTSLSLDEKQLATVGKRLNTTRNALLCAGLMCATHRAGICGDVVNFKTAVSLRDYLPAAKRDEPGCYMGVVNTRMELAGKTLQAVAKEYEKSLFTGIPRMFDKMQTTTFADITNKMDAIERADGFIDGFGATNMGTLRLDTAYDHFKVTAAAGASNRLAGNAAYVAPIASDGERAIIDFCYVLPLMSTAAIEKIKHALGQLLAEVLDEPPAADTPLATG